MAFQTEQPNTKNPNKMHANNCQRAVLMLLLIRNQFQCPDLQVFTKSSASSN